MSIIEHHDEAQAKPARGRAVETAKTSLDAAPISDSSAIIQVIERAAMNPDVDIDKMERLLQMQERIMERTAKAAYSEALAAMQAELPVITERGRIEVREKVNGERTGKVQQSTGYARWEDINEAIKPVMVLHGFALSFRTGMAGDGKITVTGVLSHCAGHSEETTITLPHDSTGSKNAVQAVGSSTSYGKRYTASALLNLTSRGEDDDGNAAGAGQTINDEQLAKLTALAAEVSADIPKFCAYLKVASLETLPLSQFTRAMEALESKRSPL